MTNPLKGQILINLGGKDYTCRLTIDAIIKVETELDKGILQITQKLSDADIRIGELAVVLLHSLRGGGNDVSLDDVKKIIQNGGIVNACTAVAELLVSTLSDPSASSGADAKKGTVTS
jgi:hypothetical protein